MVNVPATRDRIEARLRAHRAPVSDTELSQLAVYYDVLRKWNTRINLTALRDDDDGIDRLIAEPVLAARLMPIHADHLDVGSGGGSPAFPVRVIRPGFRSVLVESRSKKAAFLREAARTIPTEDVVVESTRLETVSLGRGPFSLVTIRAVRMDDALLDALEGRLSRGAAIWYFTRPGQDPAVQRVGWTPSAEIALLENQSSVQCFTWNGRSDVPRGTS